MNKIIFFIAVLLLTVTSSAVADDCPPGQKQVAFADGNSIQYVCVDEDSEMTPAESNSSLEGVEDPNNYD